MKNITLPPSPTGLHEPVLKKRIKSNGKWLEAGMVFKPTGSKFDRAVIEHYCYMRPVENIPVSTQEN